MPLQEIVDRVEKGTYKAKPAAVFSFDEIREAQRLMESNQVTGKIIEVIGRNRQPRYSTRNTPQSGDSNLRVCGGLVLVPTGSSTITRKSETTLSFGY